MTSWQPRHRTGCVCTENLIRIDLLTESLTVGRNRSNTDFAVNLVSIVRVFERPIRRYLVDRQAWVPHQDVSQKFELVMVAPGLRPRCGGMPKA